MSKSIHILYDTPDELTASTLEQLLNKEGYSVTIIPWAQAATQNYIYSVTAQDCQLIIAVNMIGLSYLSSDGGLSMNSIPMNIAVVMTRDIRPYTPLLEKRINYTISFLLRSEEEVSFVTMHYPHIYQVKALSSLSDITSYISELDWRF